ncbi:DUF317 domain-containing protein [Streptomyces caatingaensis]|uniref:DUF317 domain-containing protein n=1 Tax=Streptomyces caatingaensis TaxID=1678637 RepID=A0A0K9XK57_9ACTN|nr:DUF317 domain-containing protein [Streptomyces caatingaensis]KNB53476.1 hypothetical protein AC230_02040 [Streptomyces caatingaensis]
MTIETTTPGFRTTLAALRLREWPIGPGQATRVLAQFDAEDYHFVVDDRADVHVSSKDGRLYLGYFPEGRPGTDGEGWKIAVTGTADVPGWAASFEPETPAELIAAFVAAVISTSRPAAPYRTTAATMTR